MKVIFVFVTFSNICMFGVDRFIENFRKMFHVDDKKAIYLNIKNAFINKLFVCLKDFIVSLT